MTTLEYLQLTSIEKYNSFTITWRGILINEKDDTGKIRHWTSNGMLMYEYNIKNNVLDGEDKCWDLPGLLVFHELYENGKFIKNLKNV